MFQIGVKRPRALCEATIQRGNVKEIGSKSSQMCGQARKSGQRGSHTPPGFIPQRFDGEAIGGREQMTRSHHVLNPAIREKPGDENDVREFPGYGQPGVFARGL